MADRYFIGTGNRNLLDAANWSLTSGGSAYQPASGTEKITNAADRDFSSDTGFWTKVNGTIIDGVMRWNNLARNDGFYRAGLLTIGKSYKVSFEILNLTLGGLFISGFENRNIIFYGNGVKTFYATASINGFGFWGQDIAGNTLDIDNVSLQEVDDIAPTSSINAIFDANSGTGTITVNANFSCADLTVSNLAGGLTLSGSVYTFSVYGNLTLPATNLTVSLTGTSYWYLKATTSVNITMGATTGRSFNRLYFDGVGGTWTLQDEMNTGNGTIYLSQGTFNTNDKTITTALFRNDTVTGARTLNFGSSAINAGIFCGNSITFTLNAGTSTVTSLNYVKLPSIAYNLYNVIVGHSVSSAGGGTISNFTCNNFTNKSGLNYNVFNGNIVVNGVLTLNGTNKSDLRLLINSETIGTPRTITCNGSIVASNVDFMDITLAGTANRDLSAITGGSGDCGGNSGITFTSAVPQYYKHTGGGTTLWSDATKWFSDAALTVPGRVPLPQDDSNFIAGSFSQACTLSVNCPRIGRSLDMSGVNQAVTMTLANAVECYGSYVLGTNITPSGNFATNLYGRGNYSINTYSKLLNGLYIWAPTATYTVLSNMVITNSFINYLSTLDLNDFNITCADIQMQLAGAVSYWGNGTITTTLTSAGYAVYIVGGSLYSEGSTVILNPASGSNNIRFVSYDKTFNKVQFSGSHTGNFDFTGSNTIAELIIDAGRKVRFTAGTTQTITKLTAIGTAVAPITIDSITAATHTINYTGAVTNLDYLNIKNSIVTQANKLFAGLNSVNSGGNSGWVFGRAELIDNLSFSLNEYKNTDITNFAKPEINYNNIENTNISNSLCKSYPNYTLLESEEVLKTIINKIYLTPTLIESELVSNNIINYSYPTLDLSELEEDINGIRGNSKLVLPYYNYETSDILDIYGQNRGRYNYKDIETNITSLYSEAFAKVDFIDSVTLSLEMFNSVEVLLNWIKQYILDLYGAEYTGYINLIVLDKIYTLELGIPSYMSKSTISGEFDTDQAFLDYIYEELRIRNYVRIYFYKTIRQHEIIEE